jgi:dipeptidyl aminopeptidase/acylaminoacyl peptidase
VAADASTANNKRWSIQKQACLQMKLDYCYSYKNKPWNLFLADNKANPILDQITFSTTAAFNAYAWRTQEVINFKAQDGTTVYARLYKPEQSNANKRRLSLYMVLAIYKMLIIIEYVS